MIRESRKLRARLFTKEHAMAKLPKATLAKNNKTENWDLKEDKTGKVLKSFPTKADATKGGAREKALGKESGSVKIKKEDGLIPWSKPAREIDWHVRGMHPWPGAYTFLEGRRLVVLEGTPLDMRVDARPGTVIEASPKGLVVAAGEGAYRIERLKPENSKEMAVEAFLCGRPVSRGARLGGDLLDAETMPQTAMKIAAITGPRTKPLMPKMAMPPSVEISTT